MHPFLTSLGLTTPIFQAPMAGVSTPVMAAAVSNAGGLGALGLGASSVEAAAQALAAAEALTEGPINANFFCHRTPIRDAAKEAAWIERTKPLFAALDATPPKALKEIYLSFRDNDPMMDMLLAVRPKVASFHFNTPKPQQITALKAAGITLMATATCLAEAQAIEASGCDAIIAQGWEAGGHRGIFDPDGRDDRLSTEALTRAIVPHASLPVIAAGGIMTGQDIRDALSWGAIAAQLGTAFVGTDESAADATYRTHLTSATDTIMTPLFSGRPARGIVSTFTNWDADTADADIPAYPCTYDLTKQLAAASKAKGVTGYAAEWAGKGLRKARTMPTTTLMETLKAELTA